MWLYGVTLYPSPASSIPCIDTIQIKFHIHSNQLFIPHSKPSWKQGSQYRSIPIHINRIVSFWPILSWYWLLPIPFDTNIETPFPSLQQRNITRMKERWGKQCRRIDTVLVRSLIPVLVLILRILVESLRHHLIVPFLICGWHLSRSEGRSDQSVIFWLVPPQGLKPMTSPPHTNGFSHWVPQLWSVILFLETK